MSIVYGCALAVTSAASIGSVTTALRDVNNNFVLNCFHVLHIIIGVACVHLDQNTGASIKKNYTRALVFTPLMAYLVVAELFSSFILSKHIFLGMVSSDVPYAKVGHLLLSVVTAWGTVAILQGPSHSFAKRKQQIKRKSK